MASEDVVSYTDFYNELILGLGFKNSIIEEIFDEKGYFALLSKKGNEFPEELRFTNKSVINYLTN